MLLLGNRDYKHQTSPQDIGLEPLNRIMGDIKGKRMCLEFPVRTENAEDFSDLRNSSLGCTVSKKQAGPISAECMISTS